MLQRDQRLYQALLDNIFSATSLEKRVSRIEMNGFSIHAIRFLLSQNAVFYEGLPEGARGFAFGIPVFENEILSDGEVNLYRENV